MLQHEFGRLSRFWSAVRAGAGVAILLAALGVMLAPALAASGPFAAMGGAWSGSGTLRPSNGTAERIRCKAHYRSVGEHQLNLQLVCASDSYKFDLTGDFSVDDRSQIKGYWTERTRGVSGAIIGGAQGDRVQVRAEATGFVADLVLVTRGRRQSVTINSQAGGQPIKASITLNRR